LNIGQLAVFEEMVNGQWRRLHIRMTVIALLTLDIHIPQSEWLSGG
jgi:hypothetical protein